MNNMNLDNLYFKLSAGVFSNLAIGNDGNGTIREDKKKAIVEYINEGLLRLYTKFVLREKDVLIEMREGVTNYHLLKKYAYSNLDPEDPPASRCMPYILDLSHEKFEEDVIKVLAVYNSYNEKLPLNDLESLRSVFTPQHNVVQTANPIHGQALTIAYQASHPIVDVTEPGCFIQLPPVLVPALLAYVASRVYGNMNTQESVIKGQEHMINFETICQEAIDNDLVNSSVSTTNAKFHSRGFI